MTWWRRWQWRLVDWYSRRAVSVQWRRDHARHECTRGRDGVSWTWPVKR